MIFRTTASEGLVSWRGGRRVALAAVGVALLSGCASAPERDSGSPQQLNATDDAAAAAGAAAGDPIAQVATDARSGMTSQIDLDGKRIWVTVGEYYHSAEGSRCRRVTLRSEEGGTRVSAVCRSQSGWHTVIQP